MGFHHARRRLSVAIAPLKKNCLFNELIPLENVYLIKMLSIWNLGNDKNIANIIIYADRLIFYWQCFTAEM